MDGSNLSNALGLFGKVLTRAFTKCLGVGAWVCGAEDLGLWSLLSLRCILMAGEAWGPTLEEPAGQVGQIKPDVSLEAVPELPSFLT